MKASTFSTTTTFLMVSFGMMAFMFFGFSTFSNITYSADVVSQNLKFLSTIDATHLVKSCLEGSDGVITEDEVRGFSKDLCESVFPGMKEVNYEYKIIDIESGVLFSESFGYSDAKSDNSLTESVNSYYMFINIETSDGVHAGRINVQVR